MITSTADEHWQILSRHWRHLRSPLRPTPQDAQHFTHLLEFRAEEPRQALILGVTPELFHLPWPTGSQVRALDRSPGMIEHVWPGPPGSAQFGEWVEPSFPPGSFDSILWDGGLHLLSASEIQHRIPSGLARLLSPGGRLVVRLFSLPESPQSPDEVFAEVQQGLIPSVHLFKLRLAMALQTSEAAGIVVGHVYDIVLARFSSLEALAALTAWPLAEVLTLESYRHSPNRYRFRTTAQAIEFLHSTGELMLERQLENDYPLGERCPVVLFRKVPTP